MTRVRCAEHTTGEIGGGGPRRATARRFPLRLSRFASCHSFVLLLVVLLCGVLVTELGEAQALPETETNGKQKPSLPREVELDAAAASTFSAKTETFNLTSEIQVAVTMDTFSMCFFDRASAAKDPILCTTPQESVKAGEWVGVNLQKFIYEGYSLRLGDVIWSSHSKGVKGPITFYNNNNSNTKTEQAEGSGSSRSLSFSVQLQKEPIFPFEGGTSRGRRRTSRALDGDGAGAGAGRRYGRKNLRMKNSDTKDVRDNDPSQISSSSSSSSSSSLSRSTRQFELAQVELSQTNVDFENVISVKVKTKVGNRVKLGTLASDAQLHHHLQQPQVQGKKVNSLKEEKEKLFGLGERYGPSNQRGRKLYCWTEDGGWSVGPFKRIPKGPDTTYMPVPFMLSSRGYGIWMNTTRRTDWDLDSTGKGYYSFQVEGRELEMVLIHGRTPARSLEIFTQLTGRSLIPPEFQFGPWNNFINEFNHSTLAVKQAEIFVDLDIPSSVTDFAIHYLPGGPDFTPESLRETTRIFESYGIAPLAYFNSMIDEGYANVYKYAEENGLFIKNKRGKTWHFYYKGANYQPFDVGLLDFTNPRSAELFKKLMLNATNVGFKGFMYDYGEYVDPGMHFYDGSTGDQIHNAYPLQYQSVAYDLFTNPNTSFSFRSASSSSRQGRGSDYAPQYIYYVRSGYTGSAGKTWAAWTGDPTSDWDSESGLAAQVKGMLSAGLSGMPFIGSDIGGFVWVEPPSLELWVRWVELGAVSGIMRMQTGGTSLLGYEKTHIHDSLLGTSIYRRYAKFRTSLFPYLYTAAHESRSLGLPIMRHHLLTYPQDQVALDQEYQWMLGPSLLCAPVLHRARSTQNVYLPIRTSSSSSSKWYDLMSGLEYDESDGRHRIFGGSPLLEGGQFVEVEAALEKLPLFVQAGSIIPTLDPTVDTLNEAASDPRVTTMAQKSHILHMWVFPDERYHATGVTWDGAELTLSMESSSPHPWFLSSSSSSSSEITAGTAAGTVMPKTFTLDGLDKQNRTFIVQIAARDMHVDLIYVTAPAGGSRTSLQKLGSWDQLAHACGQEEKLSWSEDAAQKTIWICFQPSTASSLTLVQSSHTSKVFVDDHPPPPTATF